MHFEKFFLLANFFAVCLNIITSSRLYQILKHFVGYNKLRQKIFEPFLDQFVLMFFAETKGIFLNGCRCIQFVQVVARNSGIKWYKVVGHNTASDRKRV